MYLKLLGLIVTAAGVTLAESESDSVRQEVKDEVLKLVESSAVYQAVAKGLASKYQCRNLDPKRIEEAITVSSIRDTSGEWEPPKKAPEASAEVGVEIRCETGPTIDSQVLYSSTAWNKLFYLPWRVIEFRGSQSEVNSCAGVDSALLEELVRADRFVHGSWPNIAYEYGAFDDCDEPDEGMFVRDETPEEDGYGYLYDYSYVLTCKLKDREIRKAFLGGCGSSDPTIRWVAVVRAYEAAAE